MKNLLEMFLSDFYRRMILGMFVAIFGLILGWIFLTIYITGSIKLIEPNIPILMLEIVMSACLLVGGIFSVIRTIQLHRRDR